MIFFWIFFVIRLIMAYLLTIILLKQVINYIKRPNLEGLNSTRNVLLLLTVALWLDASFMIIGQLHTILLNVNQQDWLSNVQPQLVLIRMLGLYAIYRFHKLIYES